MVEDAAWEPDRGGDLRVQRRLGPVRRRPPRSTALSASAIATSARALDLPTGSLPNGAGLLFSAQGGQLGQNLRAAADIWQWQAPQRYAVVWPTAYATGQVDIAAAAPADPGAAW